jgi:hypothetical protein
VALPYLLAFLLEVGPTLSGGMAQTPITFQEIEHWALRTGLAETLQPWEVLMLHRLSSEWCVQSDKATDQDCAFPIAEALSEEDLAAVADDMRSRIRALA